MSEENTDPQVEPKVEPNAADQTKPNDEHKSDKTYSRDDLAKIVNAQVQQANQKLQDELNEKLAKAKAEGAEEAKMTADQLAQKKAEETEQQLKAREAMVTQKEAELSTRNLMSTKKLPTAIADVMLNPLTKLEADKRDSAIDEINKAINEAVQAGILEKTKGKVTPQSGSGAPTNVPDKKWADMSYTEQLAIYRDNPELASQLQTQG